jgi:endonuclease/exonuclease/phosphatase family metal-dependent hydrolase
MTSELDVVLASMNSHSGRDADGTPYDLMRACRELRADVLALQECWLRDGEPDPLERVAAELGGQLLRADLVADTDLRRLRISGETERGRWGLAVITRLPVVSWEVIPLGRQPGDMIPRAAQLVTLAVPGGSLRLVNTHLTYLLTSPVQLMRLLRTLLRSDVPTVIAGDLNMPAPVTGLAVGYRPAVKGKTFPAHRPRLQLDHVLAGQGVGFRDGEVLPHAGSDHLPVRARLHLNGSTP